MLRDLVAPAAAATTAAAPTTVATTAAATASAVTTATAAGVIWNGLASEAYSPRDVSSVSNRPRKRPRRSSRI